MKKEPLVTDLVGGKTLKTDLKINFFGEVDELSAFIMDFSHSVEDNKLVMELRKIVNLLSVMLAEVAGGFGHLGEMHLSELCELVNEYNEKAGPFRGFVVPGDTPIGAKANIVRTVTRRAERAYARLFEAEGGSEIIFEYLNKLSSLFYAIGRIYDEKQ